MKYFLLIICTIWNNTASGQDWEYLYQVDGIKVYSMSTDSLNCYKAEGVINGNLFELMAVIADLERRPEWIRKARQ